MGLLDSKADLLSFNLHDDDFNIIPNGDSLAHFTRQN
jgi:hypothetical protein